VAALAGLLRRDRALGVDASAALARLLEAPTFELLPLKSVAAQIEALPPRAHVSVTASPGKGLEATIDLAADLHRRGFAAVPHLSARMVRDRAHLAELLARTAAAGLTRAFVVGGDAEQPGDYPDGLSLLRAIHEVGPVPAAIGIPCYPDGHAFIRDDALLAALRAKAEFAAWMTTQLCFDAPKIAGWLAARRAEGLALPAIIGLPGVTEPHRLLAISARIGVRDTRRFLAKNLGLVARLARSGGFYRPDSLLRALGPAAAAPALHIEGLHLYTFNQVGPTEAWRVASLARYRGR
jgi:methylenetetrahydrofolate reductase (NADPH)